ncbi:EAL domain-containing protein [Deinococcus sp. HMF7620]|uniref:EAL domain-containing protein n=1 Tax=Deinococcus arboris TaxID=2682977 RepID=A0A7C9LQX4_9DEIO|nr:EAL domain-containing protein [Deinococcus arboris]MVN88936.1 EAL domain-containing protein [Deinococcus arboris]
MQQVPKSLVLPSLLPLTQVIQHPSSCIGFCSPGNALLKLATTAGRDLSLSSPPEREAPTPLHAPEELAGALRRGEFEVHYQPVISAQSGQAVKAEALLRWKPPGHLPISPQNFLALLEASGDMAEVGNWVLRQACHAASHWPGTRVAVNLSEAQFSKRNFVTVVKQVLRDTGLQPSRLELEVTETMLMTKSCYAARALQRLRDIGVWVVLDDFGTGYSNLACLQAFPFDGLKLDRSLVRPLQQRDVRSLRIVQGIVELGQRLQLEVTAEGVETPRQLRALQALGVSLFQGYLFARPQPHWTLSSMNLAETSGACT